MKRQVYKIDENNYIKEIYVKDFDEEGKPIEPLDDNIIIIDPPNGLYRARWMGKEWVEDMSQKDIDELIKQPILPTQSDRIDMLENIILMMMEG